MYRGYCLKDRQVLFDVPDFEAFRKKYPIFITCRHCGTTHLITHKGNDILYRIKGQKSYENVLAEKYG